MNPSSKRKPSRAKPAQKKKAAPMVVLAKRPTKPRIPRSLVEKVCGITDPFCLAAKGAKYPDTSSARTLAWTYHSRYTLSSSSDGASFRLWHPSYAFQPLTSTSGRTFSVSSAWNNYGALPGISGVAKYRIVSSGFIMRNVCAPLTSSGMVHIRSWSTPEGSNFVIVDGLSYNSSTSLDVPCNSVKELCVVTQRSSRPTQEFTDVPDDTAVVANFGDNGFIPITIYFDGCPVSTDMFDFEYFINFELILDDGASLGMLATPAPTVNSVIPTISAKITSSATTLFSRSMKALGDKVFKAASASLISYIAGPEAAYAASAIMVD